MVTNTNRYEYYSSSNVIDSESKEQYPDVLSANWSLGKLSAIPSAHKVQSIDMDKWWLFFYNYYGSNNMDDVCMIINGIPYAGMLEPGSQLYMPIFNDLLNWSTLATEKLDE